jgi:hypothetical protein
VNILIGSSKMTLDSTVKKQIQTENKERNFGWDFINNKAPYVLLS